MRGTIADEGAFQERWDFWEAAAQRLALFRDMLAALAQALEPLPRSLERRVLLGEAEARERRR